VAQILTIKYSKAKTVAVSAVDTTSYDKMAKVELRTGKEIRFRFWLSEDKAGKEAKHRPTGW
jgi:hypothetical protein